MKQLRSADPLKADIAGYIDSIAVPPYRFAAVESRCGYVASERRAWRSVWVAIPAAVAAVVLVAFAPAVVAQVQRVFQAFTIVNGRPAEVPVREVTLEQLRADMPFVIIPPANIPANLHEEINEIGAGSNGAHAMFQYSVNGAPPVLTILESRAGDNSAGNLMMRYSIGRMPAPPSPGMVPQTQGAAGVRSPMAIGHNGQFFRKVEPIEWVARGTRVELITFPGALTRVELSAILRGMRT